MILVRYVLKEQIGPFLAALFGITFLFVVDFLVKILANGELKTKLDVVANAFSKKAEEAIKAVGGNTTII